LFFAKPFFQGRAETVKGIVADNIPRFIYIIGKGKFAIKFKPKRFEQRSERDQGQINKNGDDIANKLF